MNAKKE